MFSRINTLGIFAASTTYLGLPSNATAIRRGLSAHASAPWRLPEGEPCRCIPLG